MQFLLRNRLPLAAAFFCFCFLVVLAPGLSVDADRSLAEFQKQPVNEEPSSCCNCTVNDACWCNLVSGFEGCTLDVGPDGQTCTTVGHAQCLVRDTAN